MEGETPALWSSLEAVKHLTTFFLQMAWRSHYAPNRTQISIQMCTVPANAEKDAWDHL